MCIDENRYLSTPCDGIETLMFWKSGLYGVKIREIVILVVCHSYELEVFSKSSYQLKLHVKSLNLLLNLCKKSTCFQRNVMSMEAMNAIYSSLSIQKNETAKYLVYIKEVKASWETGRGEI
jgi:hypothetical protein